VNAFLVIVAILALRAVIHFDTRDLDTHGFYIIGRTQRRSQPWGEK